jgi:hypothetical protein
MNIYNLIYVYFYIQNEADLVGKICGNAYVFVAIFMQLLLLREIIIYITGSHLKIFPDSIGNSHLQSKRADFFLSITIVAGIYFFYNDQRIERIIEKFDARDEYMQPRDHNKMI